VNILFRVLACARRCSNAIAHQRIELRSELPKPPAHDLMPGFFAHRTGEIPARLTHAMATGLAPHRSRPDSRIARAWRTFSQSGAVRTTYFRSVGSRPSFGAPVPDDPRNSLRPSANVMSLPFALIPPSLAW
jgi:hypothetical protein